MIDPMDMAMIQSEKYPKVFFRNARARFWADNTRDKHNMTCTEYVANKASIEGHNYIILHPTDDPDDIPIDFEGKVIRYAEEKPNFAN